MDREWGYMRRQGARYLAVVLLGALVGACYQQPRVNACQRAAAKYASCGLSAANAHLEAAECRGYVACAGECVDDTTYDELQSDDPDAAFERCLDSCA
jgi:hypothetical protein